jgi:hypothetical protein
MSKIVKSIITGLTAPPLHKGMTAGVIAWNYIPYTVSSWPALITEYSSDETVSQQLIK